MSITFTSRSKHVYHNYTIEKNAATSRITIPVSMTKMLTKRSIPSVSTIQMDDNSIRRLIDMMVREITACAMLFHFSKTCMTFSRYTRVIVGLRRTPWFNSSQMYSMTFKSCEIDGHNITSVFHCWIKAVCGAACDFALFFSETQSQVHSDAWN